MKPTELLFSIFSAESNVDHGTLIQGLLIVKDRLTRERANEFG